MIKYILIVFLKDHLHLNKLFTCPFMFSTATMLILMVPTIFAYGHVRLRMNWDSDGPPWTGRKGLGRTAVDGQAGTRTDRRGRAGRDSDRPPWTGRKGLGQTAVDGQAGTRTDRRGRASRDSD